MGRLRNAFRYEKLSITARSSPPPRAADGRYSELASISSVRRLQTVFELDLQHGPNCHGEPKVTAAILEQPVIVETSRTWV